MGAFQKGCREVKCLRLMRTLKHGKRQRDVFQINKNYAVKQNNGTVF